VKIASVTEWSGINALLYYGPLLMRSLGFDGSTVNLMVAGGVNIVQFLAVLPAILYIDKWGESSAPLSPSAYESPRIGRKRLLRIGSVTMAVSHLLIALLVSRLYLPSVCERLK
jgi:MFS family permease